MVAGNIRETVVHAVGFFRMGQGSGNLFPLGVRGLHDGGVEDEVRVRVVDTIQNCTASGGDRGVEATV